MKKKLIAILKTMLCEYVAKSAQEFRRTGIVLCCGIKEFFSSITNNFRGKRIQIVSLTKTIVASCSSGGNRSIL